MEWYESTLLLDKRYKTILVASVKIFVLVLMDVGSICIERKLQELLEICVYSIPSISSGQYIHDSDQAQCR